MTLPNPAALESHKNRPDLRQLNVLGAVSGSMIAYALENQHRAFEQLFYRGLSVLISLNGHQTAAVRSMVRVRYSDTERKYNVYVMLAISAGETSTSSKDEYAVHWSKYLLGVGT